MFRGTKPSPLDKSNFGAGSTLKVGSRAFLVVTNSTRKIIYLMCMETFAIVCDGILVEDANFISEDEASRLAPKLDCTRSDLDYIPEGLKK